MVPPPLAKFAPPEMALQPPAAEEQTPASMEEMYSYRLTEAETKPYRAPKPPDKPLWSGVWNFAWRPSSLKMLVWLTLGCTILAVFAAFLGWAVGQWADGSKMLAGLIFIFVGIGTAMMGFLLGSYSAACFFKIIEETAAGENDIVGPEGGLGSWIGQFLQLGFLVFCGMVVCGLFGFCMGKVGGAIMLLFLWPAVFNTFLLSAMASESWWVIINSKVLSKLADKFGVLVSLYAWTFVLLGIVIGTWSLMLSVSAVFLVLAGPVLAMAALVYARVVGRVGMLITASDKPEKKKRKKKKRRKAAEPVAADTGEDEADAEQEPS
jgi:hypothetical protein